MAHHVFKRLLIVVRILYDVEENSVIRIFRITATDDKNYQTKYYNFSAIINEIIQNVESTKVYTKMNIPIGLNQQRSFDFRLSFSIYKMN